MTDDQDKRLGPMIGVGIAIGAGTGAALFAATGNPVWIGVFAGAGIAIGAAIDQQRKRDDE